ncbi:uncharacterized protein LOC115917974 isoform X3 [Strongylocentrotus purpuratus]|nr:uncharacterized protein LOC115917974 isoform X3 [Strongylocentrotus purpuratus]
MNQKLSRSLLTAHGQLSPSPPLTPEVAIIGYSPSRPPVVRQLRRQNAVIEGVTTPRGTSRPPSPSSSSGQMEVDVPEKVLEVSRNLAESEEMEVAAEEEEEEEKDDRLDTDVRLQETVTMEAKDGIHFPVAPVLHCNSRQGSFGSYKRGGASVVHRMQTQLS